MNVGNESPSLNGPPCWHVNAPWKGWADKAMAAAAAGLALLLATAAAADGVRLLALGDSLTAGYGLSDREGFTGQLEAALRRAGHDVTVLNGGVSGDTSAGGLARLDWALADEPDAVLVALGANDGLRGLDPGDLRGNLAAILERLTGDDIPVLLAGMYAPPNLGRDYADAFNSAYPELAETYRVPLYPFFLEGVATDRLLNQADGIHPNAEGVAVMIEGILPAVTALLTDAGLIGAEGS